MQVTNRVIEELLAPLRDIDEDDLLEEEADTLEEYEDALEHGEVKGALAMVRAFAIAVPVTRGMQRVLAGDAGGWTEIERAWLLETLTNDLIGPSMAHAAAELLAYALVLGEDEAADRLAVLLRRATQGWGDCTPHAAFVERLHAHGRGLETPALGELGAYADVLHAWDEPACLADALVRACDEHVRLAVEAEDDDEPAALRFAPPIPLEIAATLALRDRRGEPGPPIVHPLLETPLAAIPSRRTYAPEDDAWFRRALDVAIGGGLLPADYRWPG